MNAPRLAALACAAILAASTPVSRRVEDRGAREEEDGTTLAELSPI
jgi:hypothetical protein